MNLNESLLDDMVMLGVRNERVKKQTASKILKFLKSVDKDIIDEINREGLTKYRAQRLNGLIKRVRELLVLAYADAEGVMLDSAEAAIASNLTAIASAHVGILKISTLSSPSINAAYSAALARPFQGRIMRDHWKKIPLDLARLIEPQIRIGYVEGETQGQIYARVRRILNRQKVNFTRTTVNTALAHFQSFAQKRFYDQNQDIYSGLQLHATLDLKTSSICKSRDGRVYEIGNEPPLPFHYDERSLYVGVIKPFSEQRRDFPDELRNSMDGLIPANLKYNDWIARQSFSRQAETFGNTRARLVRDTDITVDDLFGRDRLLTISEIKVKFPDEYAIAA